MKAKSLSAVLFTSASLFFASCATSGGNETGEDVGLACRNYKRETVKNAQAVLDWTNEAATNGEVATAFKEIGDAAFDNSTFLTGEPQRLFSVASRDWKKARVDILNEGGSVDSIEAALAAHNQVKTFCNSIGEAIP